MYIVTDNVYVSKPIALKHRLSFASVKFAKKKHNPLEKVDPI